MSTFASALGGKERQNTFSPFPFFQKKKYFLKKILCKKFVSGFSKKILTKEKEKEKRK